MREYVAGYKVPKMYEVVETMPLNSTQKPDKLRITEIMNEKAKNHLEANQ